MWKGSFSRVKPTLQKVHFTSLDNSSLHPWCKLIQIGYLLLYDYFLELKILECTLSLVKCY